MNFRSITFSSRDTATVPTIAPITKATMLRAVTLKIGNSLRTTNPSKVVHARYMKRTKMTNIPIYEFAFAHASAAATLLAIAGCEWNHHSTQREGVRSAMFCAASLFMDEIKGSIVAMFSNA